MAGGSQDGQGRNAHIDVRNGTEGRGVRDHQLRSAGDERWHRAHGRPDTALPLTRLRYLLLQADGGPIDYSTGGPWIGRGAGRSIRVPLSMEPSDASRSEPRTPDTH